MSEEHYAGRSLPQKDRQGEAEVDGKLAQYSKPEIDCQDGKIIGFMK